MSPARQDRTEHELEGDDMTDDHVVEELMAANLAVFDEQDPERRRALIASTYAPDVAFTDHDGTVTGHAALDEKAGVLHDRTPGARFRANGPLRVSAELGYLAWRFGPDGAAPLATGLDIAIVADGRIARLHTFVDAPTP